jgi:hypothetical protein
MTEEADMTGRGRVRALSAALILACAMPSRAALAQDSAIVAPAAPVKASDIVGTWRLVSIEDHRGTARSSIGWAGILRA